MATRLLSGRKHVSGNMVTGARRQRPPPRLLLAASSTLTVDPLKVPVLTLPFVPHAGPAAYLTDSVPDSVSDAYEPVVTSPENPAPSVSVRSMLNVPVK